MKSIWSGIWVPTDTEDLDPETYFFQRNLVDLEFRSPHTHKDWTPKHIFFNEIHLVWNLGPHGHRRFGSPNLIFSTKFIWSGIWVPTDTEDLDLKTLFVFMKSIWSGIWVRIDTQDLDPKT